MPKCVKCKLWHYRETPMCSFCIACLEEDKEAEKVKKCGLCEKEIERFYRGKLCLECFNEKKENKKKLNEEGLNRANSLLRLVRDNNLTEKRESEKKQGELMEKARLELIEKRK